MALTGKITSEFGIKTPAAKFFNLCSKQLDQVQNISDRIHGAKVHQGDDWHDPDSVKHWTYTVDGKVVTCKEKIEDLDEENKSMTFIFFEGDIDQHYKNFKVNIQVIDKNDGGSIVKWTIEYEKINDDVETPYGHLDHLSKVTKDCDDHLLRA